MHRVKMVGEDDIFYDILAVIFPNSSDLVSFKPEVLTTYMTAPL